MSTENKQTMLEEPDFENYIVQTESFKSLNELNTFLEETRVLYLDLKVVPLPNGSVLLILVYSIEANNGVVN